MIISEKVRRKILLGEVGVEFQILKFVEILRDVKVKKFYY